MSIATEIERLQTAKQDIKTAIENKGVTVGEGTIDTYAEKIADIQVGGSGESSEFNVAIDTSLALKQNFKGAITKVNITDIGTNTDIQSMFSGCSNLIEAPFFDTSNVTQMSSMFASCSKLTEIPQYNTSKVVYMLQTFEYCSNVTKIPELDASCANTIQYMFKGCSNLVDFGGLKNVGKGFTNQSTERMTYTFDLSSSTLLTHESLMNVINKLYDLNLTYDVANGGTLHRQKLVLGSKNLAKLTEEEIAIATNKGWNVS